MTRPGDRFTKCCPVCADDFQGSTGRIYCSAKCRNSRLKTERDARRARASTQSEKECGRCQRMLPHSDFRKDRSRFDGLYSYCRKCWRGYTGVNPRERPKWTSKAEYDAWYRANHKERLKDEWWDGYLWSTYRLTEQQYDAMLEAQGSACAICGTTDGGAGRGRSNARFGVDHDHSCCPGDRSCGACVRGLLCVKCNSGIGFLRDDPQIVTAALRYLEQRRQPVQLALIG